MWQVTDRASSGMQRRRCWMAAVRIPTTERLGRFVGCQVNGCLAQDEW